MAKHERDVAPKSAKTRSDISKASKKAPIELSEKDMSGVTGGAGGGGGAGSYLKLDYKE